MESHIYREDSRFFVVGQFQGQLHEPLSLRFRSTEGMNNHSHFTIFLLAIYSSIDLYHELQVTLIEILQ